jgi:hypothetical protein
VKLKETRMSSATESPSVFVQDLCNKKPPVKVVRVRIEADGTLSQLRFVSDPIKLASVCDPCKPMLAGQVLAIREIKQRIELVGAINQPWVACARERPTIARSQATLRIFVRPSAREAMTAIRPTLVIPMDPNQERFELPLPAAHVCDRDGTTHVGVELAGTGVYHDLNEDDSRHVRELTSCRKAP